MFSRVGGFSTLQVFWHSDRCAKLCKAYLSNNTLRPIGPLNFVFYSIARIVKGTICYIYDIIILTFIDLVCQQVTTIKVFLAAWILLYQFHLPTFRISLRNLNGFERFLLQRHSNEINNLYFCERDPIYCMCRPVYLKKKTQTPSIFQLYRHKELTKVYHQDLY